MKFNKNLKYATFINSIWYFYFEKPTWDSYIGWMGTYQMLVPSCSVDGMPVVSKNRRKVIFKVTWSRNKPTFKEIRG